MKNRGILFFVIIIVGVFSYITLYNKTYTTQIKINASLLKINNSITYIDNIAKWYILPSGKTGLVVSNKLINQKDTATISKLSAMSCLLKVAKGDGYKNVLYTITEESKQIQSVSLSYKNTVWGNNFDQNIIVESAKKSLLNLKTYIEDTKITYGYKIENTLVSDTTFLFTSRAVSNKNKKEAILNLYQSLIKTSEKFDAGFNGVKIFYITLLGQDSLRLYTGIGITKNIDTIPLYGEYTLKRMPYQKNLILGYYNGPFYNISDFFKALENYRVDNNKTSMAIPFIKFENSDFNFDDSTIINVKGYYPIL